MGGEQSRPVRLGVVSDTHGLLRPALLEAFQDVDHILHAGDVGDPAILADLEVLAPVTAVWGNVDGGAVRAVTEESVEGRVGGLPFALIHGHQVADAYERLADRFPAARLIVHGHSHLPGVRRVGAARLLNPGSAGPRRFGKPVSAAVVEIGPPSAEEGPSDPRVRFLDLGDDGARSARTPRSPER